MSAKSAVIGRISSGSSVGAGGASSLWRERPQDQQKRASSGEAWPQKEQITVSELFRSISEA
jgi:hypothetical protein